MSSTTRKGICPGCGTEKSTEYVALIPITRKGKSLQPHKYSVCPDCYRAQFKMVYGEEEECPV